MSSNRIELHILSSADVEHWDDQPRGLPGSVPRWTGHLRFADGLEIRLGNRESMLAQWPDLVERLNAADRATLLARYFGRDAHIEAHHEVVVDPVGARSEVHADDAEAVPDLGEPRLNYGVLEFWTTFLEGVRIGFAHWQATWSETEPLTWQVRVIVRGLKSAKYSI